MKKSFNGNENRGDRNVTKKTFMLVILAIITIVMTAIYHAQTVERRQTLIATNPELAKAMTYGELTDKDEETQSEHVRFGVYFARDLNGDGYAEKVKGTCKEVEGEDTLYMTLNVLENGYLKDAKIEIEADNMYFKTALVDDEVVEGNYISENTTTINLKQVQAGTQKLIFGQVRSGDYRYTSTKRDTIGKDTNKYSGINKITLTGTHVKNDGTETQIEKEIEVPVDWYGTTKAEIPYTYGSNKEKNKYQNYNTEGIVDEANQEVNLEFKIVTQESNNKLLLKKSNIEGTIPEFNGYKATKVEITGENVEYTYDEETGNFTAYREATTGENGVVTKEAYTSSWGTARYSEYKLKVTYPLAAYESASENGTIVLNIPVKATFEGYNNANEEFNNPYISNIAEDIISITYERGGGDVIGYDVQVGTWVPNPYNVYVVSKENAVSYYNQVPNDTKDTYEVKWYVSRGNSGEISNVQLREQDANYTDKFLKTDGTYEDMLSYSKNIGIYFTTPGAMFGENGWIRVYNDETDELIHEFTSEDWENYTKENPYLYDEPVNHIRIETSSAERVSSFTATSIKETDNALLTTEKTREEFDKLSKIYSYLSGYAKYTETEEYQKLKDDVGIANYDEPLSMAQISSATPTTLSTQETTNMKITIGTVNLGYNVEAWKNGTFLVKFPQEVLLAEINNITINNNNVTILGYDIYEQDGNYYLKILTENENPEHYTITIDANITPDPRKISATRDIELYAYNEECNNYKDNLRAQDIYDINGDGNTEDLVDYSKRSITFVGPTTLLTTETASDYNEEGDEIKTTVAPQIAEIDKTQNNRTAKISVQITNNYSGNISGIVVVGKTPFAGNTSQILGTDLGSTFTAKMTGPIELPEQLQGIAKVYYSENETVNNDLNDSSNNWKTAEEITDFSSIRTYAIDLSDYVIQKSEEYICTYEIEVPQDVNYNDVTYSTHAVYFYLETDEGKLADQTETNKLGFMIAKKYDLEVIKNQKGNNFLVKGATYKVTEEGSNNSKIARTNNEGKLKISDLYAGRTYELQEIRSPEGYNLNKEIIKFRTSVNENGNIQVEKIEGETKTDFSVNHTTISVTVEDEPLSRLNILKQDTEGQNLENIRFEITGKGYENRVMITNGQGIATINNLYPNEEYTIKEVRADGYYLSEGELKFIIEQAGEDYNLRIIEDTIQVLDLSSGRTEDNLPSFQIKLQNEKIPIYDFEILKTDNETNEPLANAQFQLKSLDDNEEQYYTTSKEGLIEVEGLYQYVEGKNILGEYELTEVVAPEGYITDTNTYRFRCENVDGNLQLEFLTENTFEYTVEEGRIKVNFKNSPIFTLYKQDGETQEPLPNTKFAIYSIDEERNEYSAYDVRGELVGETQEIEGQTYQIITTDENGEISLNLPQGLYKVVEVEALEDYELSEEIEDRTYYFGIDATIPATKEWTSDNYWTNTAISGSGLDSNADNKFVIIDDKNYDLSIDANNTSSSEPINIKFYDECGNGISILKFDTNKKVEWARVIAGEDEDIAYNVLYKDENNIIILMGTKSSQLYVYDQNGKSFIMDTGIEQKDNYNPIVIKMNGQGEVIDFVCIKGQINQTANAISGSEINHNNHFAIRVLYNANTSLKIDSKDTVLGQEIEVNAIRNATNVGIIYFDENLKVVWANTMDIVNNNPSGGIEIDDDGNVLYVGILRASYTIPAENTVDNVEIPLITNGSYDHMYIQYNKDGKIVWAKNFGGTGRDDLEDVFLDEDGGFVVVGQSRADITIPADETVRNEEMVIEMPEGMSSYGTAIKYTKDLKVEWGLAFDKMTNFTSVIKYGNEYYFTGSKTSGEAIIPADKTSSNKEIIVDDFRGGIFLSVSSEGKFNWILKTTSSGNSLYPINIGEEFLVQSNGGNIVRIYQKVVLPEVPEVQNIVINNYKKKYRIRTYVDGYGGTISGQGRDPYEEVTIHEDSVKDIIITPYDGFKIYYIKINDEKIEYTTREDGTVILDKFTNMTEDKEVVVVFISEEEVFTINKVNKDGEGIPGAEFEITRQIIDDPSIGENAIGELEQAGEDYYGFTKDGDTYVPDNLEVNNSIAMSVIRIDLSTAKDWYKITINAEMDVGDNYQNNAVAFIESPSNYEQQWIFNLTEKQEAQDYTLTIQGGEMYELILGYANQEGNTDDKFIINSIKVEQYKYTQTVRTDGNGEINLTLSEGNYIIKETKAPDGYILNEEEILFTVGDGNNSLDIVNKESAKVVIHHYKDGTTDKLAEDETLTGEIGTNYTTAPKDIADYEVVIEKLPSNASGQYTEDVQEVIYYYKQTPVKFIVYHYLEGTEEIVPGSEDDQINEERERGSEYTTSPATGIDNKYELTSISGNPSGTLTENETVITYYYRIKDSAGVIVHHIDTDSKEQIAPDIIIPAEGTGKYGDSYTTTVSSEIPANYEYVTRTDNWEGTMVDTLTEVTYEYKLVDPNITNQNIAKTATESIDNPKAQIEYGINYTTTIENYIGKAQVIIVDTLPYKIDVAKSSLNGGTYDEESQTITWVELVDGIDTYTNPESGNIEIHKTIKVVYLNMDVSKETIENNVSGKVKLFTPDKTSEEVTNTATTNTEFKMDITVNKVWEDNETQAQRRPEVITINVIGEDDGIVQSYDLKVKEGETNHTFTDLPKYNHEGNPINYRVEEQEKTQGDLHFYTSSVSEITDVEGEKDHKQVTITNSFTTPTDTINIIVNKIWNDNDTQSMRRPESLILVVKNGDQEVKTQEITKDDMVEGTTNQWSTVIEGLPTYDENGNEIQYTIEEREITAGDLKFYEAEENPVTVEDNQATIRNHFVRPDDTTTVTVNKIWDDNNDTNGKRPENIILGVETQNGLQNQEEFSEIVTDSNKVTDSEQKIEIVDKANASGDLYIHLDVDKVEVWQYTFGNLPKYNENGEDIIYAPFEDEVNTDDLKFYIETYGFVGNMQAGYIITNSFEVPREVIHLTVNKVWEDNDIQANRRPESIVFNVKAKNGNNNNPEEVLYTYELDVATENSYTFTGLPKYNSRGDEIQYTVEEQEKNPGDLHFYTTNVGEITDVTDSEMQTRGLVTAEYNKQITITNTFQKPDDTTEVTVTKVWNDNNNEAQKRPESINLQLKNGNETVKEQVVNVSNAVTGDTNTWQYTFTDVEKYNDDGQEIAYTVDETEVNNNDLQFYTKKLEGTTVTNTFTQDTTKVEIPVKKIWEDNDIQAQRRPESIIIVLKANGVENQRQELTKENADILDKNIWTYTFTELPKYDEYNNIINYTIEEEEKTQGDLKFYTGKVDGTTITNTFTRPTESIRIEVNKKWEDQENVYNKRPASIKLEVKQGEAVVKSAVVTQDDNWQATFTDLPKYDENGQEIEYTVDEEEVLPNDLFHYEKQIGEVTDKEMLLDEKEATITNTMTKIPSTVVVKYVDKNTGKEISDSKTKEGIIGDPFDVTEDVKDIDGYTLVEEPAEKTGVYTSETQEKIYYYAKNTRVIVKYLEQDDTPEDIADNQVLAPEVTIEGYEGKDYTTVEEEIPEYTLVATTDNLEGKMQRDEIVVIYYYAPNTNVTVKYLERDDTADNSDNKVLSPEEIINGHVGQDYTTQAKDIDGYTLVAATDNREGTMTKDPIEVIYYYAQNTKVIVKYLEKDETPEDDTDNQVLAEEVTIEGYAGLEYETEQKDIENYTFVESTNNTEGKMTNDVIEVIYYYAQNTKATVQHIDRETGEILKEETQEGKVGDLFETQAEDFEGYVLVESPEEPNIIMDKTGEQIVKYYYAHVSAGVVEKHIDDITGELLYSEEHQGNEGDQYNIPSREFDGYDLVTEDKDGNSRLPENAEGEMKRDEVIEVKYYYIKKAKVIVKYLEEDDTPEDTTDNQVLAEEEIIEGHENDSYETTAKEIEDYNLVKTPENATGTMVITKNPDGTYNTEIEVIYYYKKAAGGVIENHIDITTGNILAIEKHEGNVGDPYDIPSRNFDGYDLVEVDSEGNNRLPDNAQGNMTEEEIVVNYYYIKRAKVKVEYIDKITGEKIDEEELPGHVGDSYTTEEKKFDGYELIEKPSNSTGEMTEGEIVVKYYYARKAEVEVKYLEKGTDYEVASSETIDGYVGDKYETSAKDIPYYKFVESTDNTNGTMEKDKITVIYYYEKQVFNIGIDKWVASVNVNGISEGAKTINNKDEMYVVDIHRSKTDTADVRVTYKIRVTNKGEIEGSVGEIIEYIPEGYSYYPEDNSIQWEERNGTFVTNALANEVIQPGQHKEIEIVLRWNRGENNFGEKKNVVAISGEENPAGFADSNKEDNQSTADMMITVATGLDRNGRFILNVVLQVLIFVAVVLLIIRRKRK